ncbi:hypothetical protein Athai_07820 [Actinocatenispora thailandica]|uniref:DUF4157 domain-containing protein n=1 Tax=Actinocatenispora thailandica TaxID=227318 RepID=A0A7R7DKC6_9ACTN|nr:hypothetical protein [Actinocatenispora thailandica]BCJ33279.1 hypothetical protein Athai_07820 [Actinocatenispora thailandica]
MIGEHEQGAAPADLARFAHEQGAEHHRLSKLYAQPEIHARLADRYERLTDAALDGPAGADAARRLHEQIVGLEARLHEGPGEPGPRWRAAGSDPVGYHGAHDPRNAVTIEHARAERVRQVARQEAEELLPAARQELDAARARHAEAVRSLDIWRDTGRGRPAGADLAEVDRSLAREAEARLREVEAARERVQVLTDWTRRWLVRGTIDLRYTPRAHAELNRPDGPTVEPLRDGVDLIRRGLDQQTMPPTRARQERLEAQLPRDADGRFARSDPRSWFRHVSDGRSNCVEVLRAAVQTLRGRPTVAPEDTVNLVRGTLDATIPAARYATAVESLGSHASEPAPGQRYELGGIRSRVATAERTQALVDPYRRLGTTGDRVADAARGFDRIEETLRQAAAETGTAYATVGYVRPDGRGHVLLAFHDGARTTYYDADAPFGRSRPFEIDQGAIERLDAQVFDANDQVRLIADAPPSQLDHYQVRFGAGDAATSHVDPSPELLGQERPGALRDAWAARLAERAEHGFATHRLAQRAFAARAEDPRLTEAERADLADRAGHEDQIAEYHRQRAESYRHLIDARDQPVLRTPSRPVEYYGAPSRRAVLDWLDARTTDHGHQATHRDAGPARHDTQVDADGRTEPELYSRGSHRANLDLLDHGGGVERSMETVVDLAARAGVPIDPSRLRIVDDRATAQRIDAEAAEATAVLGEPVRPAAAQTVLEHGEPAVHLYPSAFADAETLVAVLAHEQAHVEQRLAGRVVDSSTVHELEAEAHRAEAVALERFRRYESGSVLGADGRGPAGPRWRPGVGEGPGRDGPGGIDAADRSDRAAGAGRRGGLPDAGRDGVGPNDPGTGPAGRGIGDGRDGADRLSRPARFPTVREVAELFGISLADQGTLARLSREHDVVFDVRPPRQPGELPEIVDARAVDGSRLPADRWAILEIDLPGTELPGLRWDVDPWLVDRVNDAPGTVDPVLRVSPRYDPRIVDRSDPVDVDVRIPVPGADGVQHDTGVPYGEQAILLDFSRRYGVTVDVRPLDGPVLDQVRHGAVPGPLGEARWVATHDDVSRLRAPRRSEGLAVHYEPRRRFGDWPIDVASRAAERARDFVRFDPDRGFEPPRHDRPTWRTRRGLFEYEGRDVYPLDDVGRRLVAPLDVVGLRRTDGTLLPDADFRRLTDELADLGFRVRVDAQRHAIQPDADRFGHDDVPRPAEMADGADPEQGPAVRFDWRDLPRRIELPLGPARRS